MGETSQALSDKHLQVIADCQLKLKYLVIEAGDLDLVKKKKLAIIYFLESVHDISEGFLTYDDRKEIGNHQCSTDIIELYSNHITVHLNASKERLLKEYQKKNEHEDMPTTRVTRPQATATSAAPPHAQPPPTRNLWRAGPAPFQQERRHSRIIR